MAAEDLRPVQTLEQAVHLNDAPKIARIAHGLKSSSANAGAIRLSQLCAELQASALRADIEVSRDLFAKISEEFGGVRALLSAELQQAASGTKSPSRQLLWRWKPGVVNAIIAFDSSRRSRPGPGKTRCTGTSLSGPPWPPGFRCPNRGLHRAIAATLLPIHPHRGNA